MRRTTMLLALLLACLCLAGAALAEDCPLITDMGAEGAKDLRTVATVQPPEGFALQAPADPAAEEPEYYFVPTDEASPVRFYYYTAGQGQPEALAKAALESYAMFYEDFHAGDITDAPLDGRDCLRFSYSCAYPGRDGATPVYEQTAVCYLPLREDRFVAVIASLAFGSAKDRLTDALLEAELAKALAAVRLN